MSFKVLVIGLYMMLIYWLSLHFAFLDTLFFPTLGAFSFLFVSRSFRYAELSKITWGAFVSSMVGTALFAVYPGSVSLLANVLITIWMINRFKWNAPPIVAVSLIPFFSQTDRLWLIPLSVCAALLGLIAFLYAAERLERRWPQLAPAWKTRSAAEADKLDIAG